MWNTKAVQLEVQLPADVAAEAREVQESDPRFLERVILYGLTRRSIFEDMSDQAARERSDRADETGSGFAQP